METPNSAARPTVVFGIGPHSLGKLIEWKLQVLDLVGLGTILSPHSLGKLIEWKLLNSFNLEASNAASPLAGETN